jgi:hypothetical protein
LSAARTRPVQQVGAELLAGVGAGDGHLVSVQGRRAFGSARQLGSGRWQARYLDAAGVRHTAPRTFPTKLEATRYLAQVEADLLRRSWADPKLGRVTFGEWVERCWPTTASLRPGTLVLYDYLLRRFLLPAFGSTPLGRLDTMTVRASLADCTARVRSPRPPSPRRTGCCAAS